MKTLAWKDLGDTREVYYTPLIGNEKHSLFSPSRHERNKKLLESIKHTGNISVYMLKGNKPPRLLFVKHI